jgi:hypothetical protein
VNDSPGHPVAAPRPARRRHLALALEFIPRRSLLVAVVVTIAGALHAPLGNVQE